jgi:hypothetical protein
MQIAHWRSLAITVIVTKGVYRRDSGGTLAFWFIELK